MAQPVVGDAPIFEEEQYSQLRSGFLDRTISLVAPPVSIAQDIEQSYLLHWTELYKNRFLTLLRQVLVVGIVASLLAASVALGVGICVAPHLYDKKASPSAEGPPTATAPAH